MIWGKAPVWRIGTKFDTAMIFDGTGSELDGLVRVVIHTSTATHKAVPVSAQDLTLFCIQWLTVNNVIEAVKPDEDLCLAISESGAVCNMMRGHPGTIHREITPQPWAQWQSEGELVRAIEYEPPDVRAFKETPVDDAELPGMWSATDFTGGVNESEN